MPLDKELPNDLRLAAGNIPSDFCDIRNCLAAICVQAFSIQQNRHAIMGREGK